MNININILEVASELAHELVCSRFEDDDNAIYEDITSDIITYTEKAQDLFNDWYDYYYTFLDARKEK